jgi:hypothetical protein
VDEKASFGLITAIKHFIFAIKSLAKNLRNYSLTVFL